ncbi:MAG: class I SAM-dependent methyltransferase [Actinomycetota bacterium]|nr:class I SAM-dependent methyltransferase [Actinomycetota bacterium]
MAGGAAFYVRHPLVLVARLWSGLYHRRHPGMPWLAPGAITFCEHHLTREMRALEWGSGRSTTWFATRLGSLTSVEHDPAWHEIVAGNIVRNDLSNVDLRLVPLDPHPVEPPVAHRGWGSAYVKVADGFEDESLDFVVVDGAYRMACILAAAPKLKHGGLLLVDDTRSVPSLSDWPVPPDWPVAYQSKTLVTQTTIWRKP